MEKRTINDIIPLSQLVFIIGKEQKTHINDLGEF